MARRAKGRIRKLPSGRHQAGYIGPDLQLHNAPTTFRSKIDAEAWIAAELRLVEQGQWESPQRRQQKLSRAAAAQVTTARYATEWVTGRDLELSTRRSYESTLATAIEGSSIAAIPVDQLSRQQVTAWWRALAKDKPRARSKALALLASVFNTAVDDGLIPHSPVKVNDPKAVTVSKPRKLTPIEPSQLAVLIDAMPGHLRLAVQLAAWGGLRYGELAALRRSDLRLTGDYPVVRVTRSVSFASGQTAAARVKTPKTDAGVRDVTLPSWLKQPIAEHLLAHAAPGDAGDAGGLVFPGPGGGWLWPSVFYRAFHKAREAAGVEDLRVHDLRHHAAVRAAQTGETFAAVQARLGHASARAAIRYQHAASQSDLRIAEALDRMRQANA